MTRWYAVNDRPVRLVPTADGGLDAEALDLATGTFRPDRSMFARVSDHGHDLDSLTEEQFTSLWATHLVEAAVQWAATGDGELPYAFEGWTVRVNDFPAEPLYTLRHGGADVADLEDWPQSWVRPVRTID
jgi:hypothetical protein